MDGEDNERLGYGSYFHLLHLSYKFLSRLGTGLRLVNTLWSYLKNITWFEPTAPVLRDAFLFLLTLTKILHCEIILSLRYFLLLLRHYHLAANMQKWKQIIIQEWNRQYILFLVLKFATLFAKNSFLDSLCRIGCQFLWGWVFLPSVIFSCRAFDYLCKPACWDQRLGVIWKSMPGGMQDSHISLVLVFQFCVLFFYTFDN